MNEPSSSIPSLAVLVRSHLLPQAGVAKLSHTRRFTTLFAAGSPADRLFFLDSGLVKLGTRGEDGKEIVLHIIGPGELFGEQSVLGGATQDLTAEVMEAGTVYSIPRELFLSFAQAQREAWQLFAQFVLERQRSLEQKIELLCLKDVEQRILLILEKLARNIGTSSGNGENYSVPLSQSELASFIGATRETTSTTLNLLERRGLVKLGRRLLVIPSVGALTTAAKAEAAQNATAASAVL